MADTERWIERAQQHRRARWILPLSAGAAACGVPAGNLLGPPAGMALAALILVTACRRTYRSRGSSWAKGAAGERRTARILAPLTWSGRYVVLHDRAIPGSKANIDHLVIGRTIPICVDSKNWLSVKSTIQVRRGELWYGGFSQRDAMKTVRWEADQAAQALGWPVRKISSPVRRS
ncbi:nuclease-related domain-containing protein [Streptomyces sp. H10-C2]|uniref:nuclease-related domain-containing protein n=1 Tax=unclassified Streptomyces TaxID=2593676 RepID=UPI0024BBA229|nr:MULTISPECIES: nuclease-related domain-containing protein [unclassified Streptomyces]MDJ0342836.1 nuclease-related domain-containing protein [Streptomyces sp. PH10-H1]MDJ0372514.1 nuclease-related domain-containing protein [Streptomyces sp. H10-C2]